MKAYELQEQIGFEGLRLVERAEPKPQFRQVLMKVRAASLNYRDLIIANGMFGKNDRLPVTPLSDGAGEIVAVGDGVRRFKVGDRVAANFFQGWTSGGISASVMKTALGGALDGMLAEYVALDEDGLVRIPETLTFEEAATLPCAALTAWHALVTKGGLTAGETLVTQGTGGVSVFALQFAKLLGARVIATSGSDEKLERLRTLGADVVLNHRTAPDWDAQVVKATDGVGADHIADVGGAGTLGKSFNAVRYGGRVSVIGVLTGVGGEVNPLPVLAKSVTLQGIYVGSVEMFEAMNRAIDLHELKPVIDRVFSLAEAPEAYRYLKSGVHFGKVVIAL
jgi:NADPH:quinone reductase-like Zn-dependent oxidoreductase